MSYLKRMTAFTGEGISEHSGAVLVLWRREAQGWKIDRYVDITDLETRGERSE